MTNTNDIEDNREKTPVLGGEQITSEWQQFTDVDDNGDKEMGVCGHIPEDAKSASVNKPMDVTSADEPNETDDGGKNENDSGTCNSESDSESSDSNSSNSSSSGSSEYESGSENKSSGESSKSSKLGSEKNNVHDNKSVACDITSEQKESAEVPAEEKDDESLPQHSDGGVPDSGDGDVSDPGDDLLLEKLMRETEQLEEQPPIPGAKVDR